MAGLAVNVDHVATLREARKACYPDPVTAALNAELAGADGVVVHLREDRRHIQDRDVKILRKVVQTKLILEMASTPEMVGIALDLKPDLVTIVPEKREELTTEGGLDLIVHKNAIAETVAARWHFCVR
jgi:pyridoxine 5-phosphate synthase